MGKRCVWEPVLGTLPPGVQCRHQALVGGWLMTSELVLTGTGLAEIRINGRVYGDPIEGKLSAARRVYRAVQNAIRLRQSKLPL